MIVIVDYDMGNIGSIQRMLKKLGVQTSLSQDPNEIREAEKLILPGVGAFDSGMDNLDASGLRQALDFAALAKKTTILGICLGMQLLFEHSDEGSAAGLAWVPGKVRRFKFDSAAGQKVPHMGWNRVISTGRSPLFSGLDENPRFYFVHSFYAEPRDAADSIAVCEYGHSFCCAVQRENILGVQFHPEKSHRFGLRLLRNFADM